MSIPLGNYDDFGKMSKPELLRLFKFLQDMLPSGFPFNNSEVDEMKSDELIRLIKVSYGLLEPKAAHQDAPATHCCACHQRALSPKPAERKQPPHLLPRR